MHAWARSRAGFANVLTLVELSRDGTRPLDEGRIVLAQGTSDINGPHQGALVDTPNGESWFVHFQDLDAYGRVVHLQPVTWRDGWPVIGRDVGWAQR